MATMPSERRTTLIRGRITWLAFLLALPLVVIPSTAGAGTIDRPPVWQATFGGPADDGDDFATMVELSADGDTLVVAGRSSAGGPRSSVLVIAYDTASGDQLWLMRFMPRNPLRVTALAVDERRAFVAGDEYYEEAQIHALSLSDGHRLWSRDITYAGAIGDLQIGTPHDQRLYLTGSTRYPDALSVAAVDRRNGINIWRADTQVARGYGGDLELRDGSLYFGGSSYHADDRDPRRKAVVGKVAASNGTLQWVRRFGRSGNDYGGEIALAPDGSRVFATGTLWCPDPDHRWAGYDDWMTASFRAGNGDRLWLSRFSGPQVDSNDVPNDIVADDSYVYVGGHSSSGGMAVAAYDATTGSEAWATYHGSGGGGVFTGIALGGNSLVAVGSSGHEADYRVYGLDPSTGAETWSNLLTPFSTNTWSLATDVTTSDVGSHAFVTGWIENPTTRDPETVTAAYDLNISG